MSGFAVELNSVRAGYRGTTVLREVSLTIASGRIVGIWGPNGSGKTTLLRTIQGLLPISAGSGGVLGLDLAPANHRDIRRRTACVYQTLNIDPRMPVTAGEVVMMGRYSQIGLLKHPGRPDREAVDGAMDRVDALHLRDRPFGQLSGGEQQRINLARALAQEPELLLLDEPTTFLDSESQQRVRDIVEVVHSEIGLTTIVVSHDARVLADLCEEMVLMERGAVVRVSPSREFAGV